MARIRINPEINPSVEQPILSWFANSYGPDSKQVKQAYSRHTNFVNEILYIFTILQFEISILINWIFRLLQT